MRQDLKHVTPEQAVAGTGGDADAQTMAVARGITVDSPSKRPQLSSNRCSKKADPAVYALVEDKKARQTHSSELIASQNYT